MYESGSPYAADFPLQRFDDVDGRLRPVTVVVERNAGERPFRIEGIECFRHLDEHLVINGIAGFTYRSIRCIVARDDYAPKHARVFGEEDIVVCVRYADLPQNTLNGGAVLQHEERHVAAPGFGSEDGTWRASA